MSRKRTVVLAVNAKSAAIIAAAAAIAAALLSQDTRVQILSLINIVLLIISFRLI